MTVAMEHTSYSIGYAETSYTAGTVLGYAATTAAAAAKPAITPGNFSIVSRPGRHEISGPQRSRRPGRRRGLPGTRRSGWCARVARPLLRG